MDKKDFLVALPKQAPYIIRTDLPWVKRYLFGKFGKYVYEHFLTKCDRIIEVKKKNEETFLITFSGEQLVSNNLRTSLNNLFYSKAIFDDDVIVMHGAAVGYNQKAFLFLAPTNSGKSTLTSFLCLKGFDYQSEDCVLIDKKSLKVLPYTTPIHLRPDGLRILKQDTSFSLINKLKNLKIDDRRRVSFSPSNESITRLPIGAIFFTSLSATNELLFIDKGTAFQKSLESLLTKQNLTPSLIQDIIKINEYPVYNLQYKDMTFVESVIMQVSK